MSSAQTVRQKKRKPPTKASLNSRLKVGKLGYVVSYDEHGWRSRVDDSSIKLLSEAFHSPPPQDFLDAMDACCDAFYPEIERRVRPWHCHSEWVKDEDSNKLRDKANDPWQLDWYWKALITYLPEWFETKARISKLSVTLSQVRRWVLLTTYSAQATESEVEAKAPKVSLLRPPIFGRSNRLADWDQYWLYLLERNKIAAAWRNLKGEDRIDNAYIMGRHDITYNIEKSDIRVDGNYINVSVGGFLTLDTHVMKTELDGVERIVVPHDLVSVPVFSLNPGESVNSSQERGKIQGDGATTNTATGPDSKSKGRRESAGRTKLAGLAVKEIPLLLASDSVCKVLEVLSEVWNDPTIQSVHINAPPGSGKEVLTKTVYWFQERRGALAVTTWLPGASERNQQALFGSEKEPGLVEKARRGCLVLDEIDKSDESTRAALLRLLENGQYTLPGTSQVKKLSRVERPLYVCLSSRPIEEVLAMQPPDFWTRIQLTVEMAHPLLGAGEQDRKRVAAQYFHLFWIRHVERFFEREESRVILRSERASVVKNYFSRIVLLFLSGEFPRYVASVFASAVASRYKRISVRNIRTIAERCVFNFVQRFVYNVDVLAGVPMKRQDSDVRKRIEGAIFRGKYGELLEDHVVAREIERIVENSMGGRVDYPG